MNKGAQFVIQRMPTVPTTLYTVPAGKYADIRQITAVNLDRDSECPWWLTLNGVALVDGSDHWAVPPGESLYLEEWKVLNVGELITGYCAGAMNIFISGLLADI